MFARAAGVSPSTVSRALHDSPRISEKVRERVKQAAKALDFHPNQMAKSLVSRKTRIVGIVFPGDVSKSLGNPFYPSLLQGLGACRRRTPLPPAAGDGRGRSQRGGGQPSGGGQRVCERAGAVGGGGRAHARPRRTGGGDWPPQGRGGDGTMWTMTTWRRAARPRSTCWRTGTGASCCWAMTDATSSPWTAAWAMSRRWTMRASKCARRGLSPAVPSRDPDASEKLIAIFRAKDRPTAAVCMDDALAIGLTGLLKGMGLDVPGDVSIVSFNNTDAGKYHIPALTSFEIDPYRLGMSAHAPDGGRAQGNDGCPRDRSRYPLH